MVDFVLGRLKFVWQGSWTSGNAYTKDDVVRYGGRVYVCLTNHTAGSATGGFETALTAGYWQLMSDGISFLGSWSTGTYYKVNDIVKYGADTWICTTAHTAGATFPVTESNFAIFAAGAEFLSTYNPATLYVVGDIVTYGGYAYIALTDTQGNTPTTSPSYWSVLTTGYTPAGVWSNATSYKIGSVVNYGAYSYVAAVDNVNRTPNTSSSYWTVVAGGQQYAGTWSSSTAYKLGDVVSYGAFSYAASVDNTNQAPSQSSSYWTLVSKGIALNTSNGGNWSNSVSYKAGDVVAYSGYSYVANTDNINTAPSNTSVWYVLSEGFNFLGAWSNTATYQVGDTVSYLGSTYVSTVYSNLNAIPGANTNWSTVAQGAAGLVLTANGDLLYQGPSGNARLPIGTAGQTLTVNSTGYPAWGLSGLGTANGVYYVSKNGSDSANGTSLQTAFATIQRAAQTVPNNSTIFVKTGTYSEVLPIVLGSGVSVVGDSQRTVVVQPANSSYSGAGNTMFQLSDGTLLKSMTFTGMTGFSANNSAPSDITTATFGGVFVGFNPASPILTKSPYIFECSAISTGGTGAMVNGAIHATGNKSMLFHAYTNINDGGVGYYVSNGARAEIVSCFTYYCYFGLATASGGFIRGLNNNNSYGNYGASSRGFDSTETPVTGALTGNMLNVTVNTVGTSLTQGEYFRGQTSGANGYVFTHQTSANSLYFAPITGSFTNGEVITGQTSNVGLTIVSTGNGQSGFILVANGLPGLPNTGGSIIFDSGDTSNAYVIQSVSGSYVNTQSNVIITLANQKTAASPSGNTFVIRYKYSQIRLMGHDFLNIGTGNTVTTNYPGTPSQAPVQSQQVSENYPGRVFYVATDQSGNFYVGTYFNVQQATGIATLNSSAFNLSGLSTLRLGAIGAQLGETINEFSSDGTLSANSVNKVPTQSAVTQYVATKAGLSYQLDDISYQFDGQTKSFNLTYSNSTVSNTSLSVFSAPKVDVLIGNLPVKPATRLYDYQNLPEFSPFQSGFYLSSSNSVINFATAPTPGMSFYGTVRNVQDSVNDFSYLQALQVPFTPLSIMLGA